MAVPCSIKVLEHGLQVNPSHLDSSSVFIQDSEDRLIGAALQVLTSC